MYKALLIIALTLAVVKPFKDTHTVLAEID